MLPLEFVKKRNFSRSLFITIIKIAKCDIHKFRVCRKVDENERQQSAGNRYRWYGSEND